MPAGLYTAGRPCLYWPRDAGCGASMLAIYLQTMIQRVLSIVVKISRCLPPLTKGFEILTEHSQHHNFWENRSSHSRWGRPRPRGQNNQYLFIRWYA